MSPSDIQGAFLLVFLALTLTFGKEISVAKFSLLKNCQKPVGDFPQRLLAANQSYPEEEAVFQKLSLINLFVVCVGGEVLSPGRVQKIVKWSDISDVIIPQEVTLVDEVK